MSHEKNTFLFMSKGIAKKLFVKVRRKLSKMKGQREKREKKREF